MTDLPFEVFYALYERVPIERVVYVLIASQISCGGGSIQHGRLAFTTTGSLPHTVRKVLTQIRIGRKNSLSWEKANILSQFLWQVLKKKKFVLNLRILGVFNTHRFRRFVREHVRGANKDILSFIGSGRTEDLNAVDNRISKTTINIQPPDGFYSFYKDPEDMWSNAISTTVGRPDLERYRYYYTRSGERRHIK